MWRFTMEDSDKRLDKESWIKARTNTPDKLGKDVWSDYYNKLKDYQLRGTSFTVSPDTQKKMMGEFLEKNGISSDNLDNVAVRGVVLGLFQNMSEKTEKGFTSDSIKTVVDMTNNLSKPTKNISTPIQSNKIER